MSLSIHHCTRNCKKYVCDMCANVKCHNLSICFSKILILLEDRFHCVIIISCCELNYQEVLATLYYTCYLLSSVFLHTHASISLFVPSHMREEIISWLPSWVNLGWQFKSPKTCGYRVYRDRAEIYTQLTDRWVMVKGWKEWEMCLKRVRCVTLLSRPRVKFNSGHKDKVRN